MADVEESGRHQEPSLQPQAGGRGILRCQSLAYYHPRFGAWYYFGWGYQLYDFSNQGEDASESHEVVDADSYLNAGVWVLLYTIDAPSASARRHRLRLHHLVWPHCDIYSKHQMSDVDNCISAAICGPSWYTLYRS